MVYIVTALLVLIMLIIASFFTPHFLKSHENHLRIVKRLRLMLIIISTGLLLMLLIFFVGCNGRVIVGIQIGSFPDNIVYYIGESDTIDLTGGTILVFTKGRTYGVNSTEGSYVQESPMSRESVMYQIIYDIDFSVPGVYCLRLRRVPENWQHIVTD